MIFLIFLVLFLLFIWLQNSLSNKGETLANLYAVEADLTLQNQLLGKKLAEELSLRRMAEKAKDLGFIPIKSVQVITTY